MIFALAFLPPLLLGVLILKYGVDLIDWDQWEVAALFEKAAHGSLSLGDLFAQQAEYRQFFPNLIFIGLGWLTHWNIKYEMLMSFSLGCLVAFNIYRLGQVTGNGDRSRYLVLTLTANLLIFAPAQFENWLLGEQIIYFVPIACLTTGLRVAYSQLNQQTKLIICMLLSTVSTFSSANGIVCWIVIAPVLLFPQRQKEKKIWRFVVWSIGFVVSAAIYFYDFHKPSYTPSLWESSYHPLRGFFFFCALLGAPLVTSYRLMFISASIGAILITLFTMACYYFLKIARGSEIKRRLACWLMLGTYSVLTAIIITIARIGFGSNQALNSRYITFTVYLLVSLCYLIPIIIDDLRRQNHSARIKILLPRLISFALASLLFLHLLNTSAAIGQMAWMKTRRLQAKACLLFINAVPSECLNRGFPSFDTLSMRINAINELGYLRPSLIKSNRIEDIADTSIGDPSSYGRFERLIKTNNDELIATGWASLPERLEPADAVLLTYQKDHGTQVIFALAEMRIEQLSSAALFVKAGPSAWRWQKPISLDSLSSVSPVRINAWAFDATTGKAYKLSGTYISEEGNGEPRFQGAGDP